LSSLELFGAKGELHTKDYAHKVASLEVWEINPRNEAALRRNLSMADVKITNSYDEIKKTQKKYDLIVIDNPDGMHGEHCEHFDLFPDVFQIAKDQAILLIDVIPGFSKAESGNRPPLFNEAQLARRKAFYESNHPENVSFDEMTKAYSNFAQANGFHVEWHFIKQRTFSRRVYYLVLKIRKSRT